MTSQELDTTTEGRPPVPVPLLTQGSGQTLPSVGQPSAVAALMQHAEVMATAHHLATKLVGTELVPARYRGKPDDAAAAILYGAELGLNPIQSLQQVFAVHGQPSIYARTMVALLKSRGYRFATIDETDEEVTFAGESPAGDVEESTWSIARAQLAGYVPEIDERTGKYKLNDRGKLLGNMKYITDPRSMLWAKAAAEVCRRLAPDVLLGISYTVEDLDYVDGEVIDSRPVTDKPARGARGLAGLKERLGVTASSTTPAPADTQPASETQPESETPQASSPPTAAEEPPALATPAQRKELNDLLEKEGYRTQAEKQEWLGNACHRDIGKPGTKAALRADEADELINYLKQLHEADAEKRAADQEGTQQ